MFSTLEAASHAGFCLPKECIPTTKKKLKSLNVKNTQLICVTWIQKSLQALAEWTRETHGLW